MIKPFSYLETCYNKHCSVILTIQPCWKCRWRPVHQTERQLKIILNATCQYFVCNEECLEGNCDTGSCRGCWGTLQLCRNVFFHTAKGQNHVTVKWLLERSQAAYVFILKHYSLCPPDLFLFTTKVRFSNLCSHENVSSHRLSSSVSFFPLVVQR